MNLYQVMVLYQEIFNPKYFLFFAALLIAFYDWKNSYRAVAVRDFFGRVTVITLCFSVSLTTLYLLILRIGEPSSPALQYREDFATVVSMLIGLTLCLVLWWRLGYGRELKYGVLGLIVVAMPYTIISFFWNISGHVTFTAAPVTYLVALDRRLVVLYLIPAVMVLNRPIVGAHTPLQSVAGFILGTSLMLLSVKLFKERGGGACITR
jgi:membrane-associated phospholipid phosphatase